jgi:hypothetical protein
MNDEMKQKYLDELLNFEKMKFTLRTDDNLSAPDLDEITNSMLKIEMHSTAITMIELTKILINSRYCPNDWTGQELF